METNFRVCCFIAAAARALHRFWNISAGISTFLFYGTTRVKGLENEPEGGKRCEQCFRLRLLEAGKIAKRYNFDYFCSTLTVSRHKNAELINSIGEEISKAVGVPWLPSDFKKKDGENRSVELSERLGIYRQLYCGCRYSLSAREAGTPDNNREDTE